MSSFPSVVYRHRNGLYLNITNRCPTNCVFCLKHKSKMIFMGCNLNLEGKEPSAEEAVELAGRELFSAPAEEIVFCGFGEPTMRLDALLEIAAGLKREHGRGLRVRLNTVGLGSLVNGKDIAPLLAESFDSVHVSLNAADKAKWLELVRPLEPYREEGFAAVVEFLRSCSKNVGETVATVVDLPGIDAGAARELAEKAGAAFRLRQYL